MIKISFVLFLVVIANIYADTTSLKELPLTLYNTERTSLSIVHKEQNSQEPDFSNTLESLWYISHSDTTVNIFINGLDFQNGTYDNEKRHEIHKKEWYAYYMSNVFKKDYNLVYSWDSSMGIQEDNTRQIKAFIRYVLEHNNKNDINLIAHSHGGNLAKEVLVELYDANVSTKNISLVTLGTPHKGISTINSANKLFVPAVEVAYKMLFDMRNLDELDEQVVQATKRMYSGSYDQLQSYDDNAFLQSLNDKFRLRGLTKNSLFISAKNDEIIDHNSSSWPEAKTQTATVNNRHSDLVDTPDAKVFALISKLLYENKSRSLLK